MKKQILLFLILGTTLTAYCQRALVNDPNAEKRTLSGPFHGIEVSHAIDLYLSQGEEEGVAVSARDTKNRDRIRTEVKDGILHIWFEKDGLSWASGNKKLRAYVSFRNLDHITGSGACDIVVNGGFKGAALEIKLSGASDFKGNLAVESLLVGLSGASDMTIEGNAAKVDIHASGASDFKGYELITQHCDVEASGASDIRITVEKEINGSASGASDIHYKGNGVMKNVHTSGASSFKKV